MNDEQSIIATVVKPSRRDRHQEIISNRRLHHRFTKPLRICWILLSALVGVCSIAVSCGAPTVWKADVLSPDRRWIARVETIQNGGFGSAAIDTAVYLKRADIRQDPIEVLNFSCNGPVPRPYTLDNTANAGGTISLTMKWTTPSHLDVTYKGPADLTFQAIKCAGIDITVEDLSASPPK